MLKLNKVYFFLALIFLAAEVLIGLCLNDAFIRPYGGDFLVVILLYCGIRSFADFNSNYTAICVLLFAYLMEFSQRLHLINRLGLHNSAMARLILGTSFSWNDILMYTLGILFVWLIERLWRAI
ncbi:DUF2809 domain-containing protein [Mucilaginibacter sp. 14171R-50]|uniref:ribosomal maturation YjgA family protein n=1 Tax=Mucilaginibacter sp. 14171R-50 TaxID=2703789 RepID=UPI00138D0F4B|nr:DUF2809 domain-containing protein [Mucilaginibacter sp. 14171R-50]QHS56046.1 DUF2809 domain-containing protein [Mucilaginibacter sp. 14171R-50]